MTGGQARDRVGQGKSFAWCLEQQQQQQCSRPDAERVTNPPSSSLAVLVFQCCHG